MRRATSTEEVEEMEDEDTLRPWRRRALLCLSHHEDEDTTPTMMRGYLRPPISSTSFDHLHFLAIRLAPPRYTIYTSSLHVLHLLATRPLPSPSTVTSTRRLDALRNTATQEPHRLQRKTAVLYPEETRSPRRRTRTERWACHPRIKMPSA